MHVFQISDEHQAKLFGFDDAAVDLWSPWIACRIVVHTEQTPKRRAGGVGRLSVAKALGDLFCGLKVLVGHFELIDDWSLIHSVFLVCVVFGVQLQRGNMGGDSLHLRVGVPDVSQGGARLVAGHCSMV